MRYRDTQFKASFLCATFGNSPAFVRSSNKNNAFIYLLFSKNVLGILRLQNWLSDLAWIRKNILAYPLPWKTLWQRWTKMSFVYACVCSIVYIHRKERWGFQTKMFKTSWIWAKEITPKSAVLNRCDFASIFYRTVYTKSTQNRIQYIPRAPIRYLYLWNPKKSVVSTDTPINGERNVTPLNHCKILLCTGVINMAIMLVTFAFSIR